MAQRLESVGVNVQGLMENIWLKGLRKLGENPDSTEEGSDSSEK